MFHQCAPLSQAAGIVPAAAPRGKQQRLTCTPLVLHSDLTESTGQRSCLADIVAYNDDSNEHSP
jgi:hypothetical protein